MPWVELKKVGIKIGLLTFGALLVVYWWFCANRNEHLVEMRLQYILDCTKDSPFTRDAIDCAYKFDRLIEASTLKDADDVKRFVKNTYVTPVFRGPEEGQAPEPTPQPKGDAAHDTP